MFALRAVKRVPGSGAVKSVLLTAGRTSPMSLIDLIDWLSCTFALHFWCGVKPQLHCNSSSALIVHGTQYAGGLGDARSWELTTTANAYYVLSGRAFTGIGGTSTRVTSSWWL